MSLNIGISPRAEFNRRDFLAMTFLAGAGAVIIPSVMASGAAMNLPGFRTVTYNVLKCQGFSPVPEAKPFIEAGRAQIPLRLALELALYNPDIISFQEAPPEKTVAFIAGELRMKYAFFKGGWNGAVLSKYDIADPVTCPLITWNDRPEDLFTRHWGRAIIHAPIGKISFFSAHLHPSDQSVRQREVSEMLKVMAPELKDGGRVILQGDLNHTPSGPEYARWTKAGLADLFTKVRLPGGIDQSFHSHGPEKRIDYIWASPELARGARECRILYERAFRTNPQDPTSVALSDHIPVMADFGG